MKYRHYDYAIAGGGIAGTTLAYYLSTNYPDKSILVVSPQEHTDKIMSFWMNEPFPFPKLVLKSWKQLQIFTPKIERKVKLHEHTYFMISSHQYIEYVQNECQKKGNVTFEKGPVTNIEELVGRVQVVFDGRGFAVSGDTGFHTLKMVGLDGEVTTKEDIFTPDTLTFFDFRLPSKELMLMYVLPVTPTRAIIETAVVSREVKGESASEELIHRYMREILKVLDYTLDNVHHGALVLSDAPVSRVQGDVIAIGARAGQVRPTTGFGFVTILNDCKYIAEHIDEKDFQPMVRNRLYRTSDIVMMELFHNHPGVVKTVFPGMIQQNTIDTMLGFLNETNTLEQNKELFRSINPLPFALSLANPRVWYMAIQ